MNIATSLKTRQGLKQEEDLSRYVPAYYRNELENPTGIETSQRKVQPAQKRDIATSLKTRQGLKLIIMHETRDKSRNRNELENPTGIETNQNPRGMCYR